MLLLESPLLFLQMESCSEGQKSNREVRSDCDIKIPVIPRN